MSFYDRVSSWFSSNRHNLSSTQQQEVKELLHIMKIEIQDDINSSSSNTSRRLEALMQSHTRRLYSDMEDSKMSLTRGMSRMSNELDKMKKQFDDEEKKRNDATINKLSNDYKMMLDTMKESMKLFAETSKSNKDKEKEKNDATINKLSNDYKMMLDTMKESMKLFAETSKSNKDKEKEKDDATINKLSNDYKMMLDMMKESMKLFAETSKSNNSYPVPPGGFPPYPGYGYWPPPHQTPYPPYLSNPNPTNPPEYYGSDWSRPPSHSSSTSNISSRSSGIYPDLPEQASVNDMSSVKDSPKELVVPDKSDHEKYGIEREGKDVLNVSKKLNSSKTKFAHKNCSSVVLEPTTKNSRSSSLGLLKSDLTKRPILPDVRLYKDYDLNNDPGTNHNEKYSIGGWKSESPKKLILPDIRLYKDCGRSNDPGTNHGEKYFLGRRKSTSKSRVNLDNQHGHGLILPDSRDYNKIITASLQKNREDDFEKMVNDFSQEFRPESKSVITRNEKTEKKLADVTKNFFLKEKLNTPKQRAARTSSSNASVNEWLLNQDEEFGSHDDGHESDSSEVSVRTDISKFSSVSATSGKRVFWNKSGNYGKPASAAACSSRTANINKSLEPKTNNSNYKYTANQNRQRKMNKGRTFSNSTARKSTSETASTASTGTLSEIHYPSKKQAAKKNLDLSKPLPKQLLFLGKNEDDEWTSHTPKCLNDIYELEKKYKIYKTIEIA